MRHPHPKVPRPGPRHKLLPALLLLALLLLLLQELLLQLTLLLQLMQLRRGEAPNASNASPKDPCQALLLAGLLHALRPHRDCPYAHRVRRHLPARHLVVLLWLLVRGPVRARLLLLLLLLLCRGHAWYRDQLAAQVPAHELQHQPLNSCPCARHKPARMRAQTDRSSRSSQTIAGEPGC
jgi:hypothetical protein